MALIPAHRLHQSPSPVINSTTNRHLSAIPRMQLLKQRKLELNYTLTEKNNLLKELCCQEAELIGLCPNFKLETDFTTIPTTPISLRGKIDTRFLLPENLLVDYTRNNNVDNNSNFDEKTMNKLLLGRDIHHQILEAAFQLANDSSYPKAVRSTHKQTYEAVNKRFEISSNESRKSSSLENICNDKSNEEVYKSNENNDKNAINNYICSTYSNSNTSSNVSFQPNMSLSYEGSDIYHSSYRNSPINERENRLSMPLVRRRYTSVGNDIVLDDMALKNSSCPKDVSVKKFTVGSKSHYMDDVNLSVHNGNKIQNQEDYFFPDIGTIMISNHNNYHLESVTNSDLTNFNIKHGPINSQSVLYSPKKYKPSEHPIISVNSEQHQNKNLNDVNFLMQTSNSTDNLDLDEEMNIAHNMQVTDNLSMNQGLGGFWMKLQNNERVWCSVDNRFASLGRCVDNKVKSRSANKLQRTVKATSLGNIEILHKPDDSISISSASSDNRKHAKEKQWTETSLDTPTVKSLHLLNCRQLINTSSSRQKNKLSSHSMHLPKGHNNHATQIKNWNPPQESNNAWKIALSATDIYNSDSKPCLSNHDNSKADTTRIFQDIQQNYNCESTSSMRRQQINRMPINLHKETCSNRIVETYNQINNLPTTIAPQRLQQSCSLQSSTAVSTSKDVQSQKTSTHIMSPEIRIESPKNMTIIQQARFQPYKEESKPFEMSDFYKYSTKYRQQQQRE